MDRVHPNTTVSLQNSTWLYSEGMVTVKIHRCGAVNVSLLGNNIQPRKCHFLRLWVFTIKGPERTVCINFSCWWKLHHSCWPVLLSSLGWLQTDSSGIGFFIFSIQRPGDWWCMHVYIHDMYNTMFRIMITMKMEQKSGRIEHLICVIWDCRWGVIYALMGTGGSTIYALLYGCAKKSVRAESNRNRIDLNLFSPNRFYFGTVLDEKWLS